MVEKPLKEENLSSQTIGRRTFFSFLVLGLSAFAGYKGWRILMGQPRENGMLKPFRKVMDVNEKVNAAFYSNKHLAKTYPKDAAVEIMRLNGDIGLDKEMVPEDAQLHVESGMLNLSLKPYDIEKLPRHEIVYEFKCIEGWSEISYWSGARFSDFMKQYNLGTRDGSVPDESKPENLYKYAGFKTPDGKYYVGIDMKSLWHPQTILCYRLNDKPLSILHGYPLRLIIPVKYGTKNLKCIGSLYFSDVPPPDYWHERGYDYDAAL